MDDGLAEDQHVWYVAYGSNLSLPRLRRYLAGAAPVADPVDAVATTLPHRLFFAHRSRFWTGGGTAFVDPDHDADSGTRATAWLVRIDQFLAIVAGENRRKALPIDVNALPGPGARRQVDERRYGLALGCDSPDHRPAYTVTTPERPLPDPNAPAADYLETVVAGLVDRHGMTDVAAREYLAARGSVTLR